MLAWRARRSGHSTPSPATIARKLNSLGLANKPLGPKDNRRYPKPPQLEHGDVRVMDLWSSWWVGDARTYIATVGDPVSRIALGELAWVVSNDLYVQALARSWQHMGPFKRLTSDNGVGLCLDMMLARSTPVVRWCLARGAEVTFIPPAQPWRNGRLERFHWTMEREYWVPQQPSSKAAAGQGLLEWLNEYNLERPHSALDHDPPARHGAYEPLYGEVVPYELPSRPQPGTVSFIRLVESGGLVDCQGAVLRVSPVLVGQFVTVRLTLTPGEPGPGEVRWEPKKGLPHDVVATFQHRVDAGKGYQEGVPVFADVRLPGLEHEVQPNTGLLQAQYDKRVTKTLKRAFGGRGKAVRQARAEEAAAFAAAETSTQSDAIGVEGSV